MTSVHLVNHSHLSPDWHWLQHRFQAPALSWSHHSNQHYPRLRQTPLVGEYASRLLTAQRAIADAARQARPLLVSHGPRPAYYAARLAQLHRRSDIPHLVYSFNFTVLPGQAMRREMQRAYRSVDRFTVFSSMEKTLYAEYFDLDPDRIDMRHWAIEPPDRSSLASPPIEGRYICAVGSQGRDYATLLEAARRLPRIPLHLVVHPENIRGLELPPNVTVHTSIPNALATRIIAHAEIMVLPLLHAQVPCGHVTAVMAMHLERAILATDSAGLHDYLRQGDTAELVPAADPAAMARALERLWQDPAARQALGRQAGSFARGHCLETHAADYFRDYLQQRMGLSLPATGPRVPT